MRGQHKKVHPGTPVTNRRANTKGIVKEVNYEDKVVIISSPPGLWKHKLAYSLWLTYHRTDMSYKVSFEEFNRHFDIERKKQLALDGYARKFSKEEVRYIDGQKPDFEPTIKWPDPTPEMLSDPTFDVIWNVIKTWDINVPEAYQGYCGATGNHARAILDAFAEHVKPCME